MALGYSGIGYGGGGGGASGGIIYNRPIASGQSVSYRTGDDAYFTALRDWAATGELAAIDGATNWNTLSNNNVFGNLNRFTNDLGGTVYNSSDGSTASYMIDHLTGYGWDRTGKSSLNWNTHIDNGLAHTLGSYTTGWFLPSWPELLTLADMSRPTSSKVFHWFSGSTTTNQYYTSTTNPGTSNAIIVDNDNGLSTSTAKTNVRPAFYCRVHYT